MKMVILFTLFKMEAITLYLFLQGDSRLKMNKELQTGEFQEIAGVLLTSLAQQ